MTMESVSPMCLHCTLAMVLTSSFNGNHWIVQLCSACVRACVRVYGTQRKFHQFLKIA